MRCDTTTCCCTTEAPPDAARQTVRGSLTAARDTLRRARDNARALHVRTRLHSDYCAAIHAALACDQVEAALERLEVSDGD